MINLKSLPLSEWAVWQQGHQAALRKNAGGLDRATLERLAAKLKEIEESEGALTLKDSLDRALERARERRAGRDSFALPAAEKVPAAEPESEHVLGFDWMPFSGHGRYSPSARYHLAWGKVDDEEYRVAVMHDGTLITWLKPSVRVVGGWISDSGIFVVKAHVSEDEVCFCFSESCGAVFHQWVRDWRFLTFLRLDADGMGFAYNDDGGTHEVRFEV